jgi:hypothetical protein
MFIEIINVQKKKNKELIGKVYKVRGTTKSEEGLDCYTLVGSKKIIYKEDCKVLDNVLLLRKGA